jgi:hypothetical protein
MVLKPSFQQQQIQTTGKQTHFAHNPSVVTTGRVDSTERLPVHSAGPAHRVTDRLLPPPSEGTWASTVMTWGGFATTGTPPVPPSSSLLEERTIEEDPHAAPSWNEQSVFMSSKIGEGGEGTRSVIHDEHLTQSSTSADGGDMTRSTISVLNNEAQRNAQGVANLLQTVRRLGK